MLTIAALAAVLYARNIGHAGYAPYYSVAVKSMSVSWKAMAFGALDPGATVTIDKLAGSFVPQALSARVFGFHQWSLALPQVIEGVISVLVMYRIVRRWAGAVAALLAAGVFAFTPILASMFGHSMEDGFLTMCLVLAADRYQAAVGRGRLHSLLMAGVWVGIGFQAKMLEAWMITPALAIGYLLAAPVPLRRRLAHVSVAGMVMIAASASWMLLMTAVPVEDRPYVDGSTNNSVFAMVVGYNGVDRFGIHVPGAVSSNVKVLRVQSGPQSGPRAPSGPRPFKLGAGGADFITGLWAVQIGWLYPLAILSLVLGLWWNRRRPRTDIMRAGYVMWGIWLATGAAVFGKILVPHAAYLALLAPPLAALAAAGIVMGWRAYREGGAGAWALPAMIAAETAWAVFLSRDHLGFLPGLLPAAVVAALVALVVLTVTRIRPDWPGRLGMGGLVLGTAAMLAVPAGWAASVLNPAYAGGSLEASAGPASILTPGGPDQSALLTSAQARLLKYTTNHRGGARYLFAADSWFTAGPYIVATGSPILPLGGFSGSAPRPSLNDVKQMVHTGRLRFLLLGPTPPIPNGPAPKGFGNKPGGSGTAVTGGPGVALPSGGPADGRDDSSVGQIRAWVSSVCPEVPPSAYGGTTENGGTPTGPSTDSVGTLRDCGKQSSGRSV